MIIIGFGHKKRRGKDQSVKFAMAFCRQFYPHLTFDVLSFGDQLKDIAYRMFKWGGLEPGVYYENNPIKIEEVLPPIGKSPRQIWDTVGLMGREISPKVWTQMAMERATDVDILFCKDVRFKTEVDLIASYNGYTIRLDRTAAEGSAVDQALNDYTGWYEVIDNNAGLKELNLAVKRLICGILNRSQTQDKVICPGCFASGRAVLIGLDPLGDLRTELYRCDHCKKEHS